MWGVGLLIFYVANVANVANVIQVHFWYILRHILAYFVTAFPAQKRYLCTEFQSALNTAYPKTACAKSYALRNYWAYLTNKRQKYVVPLQRNFNPQG